MTLMSGVMLGFLAEGIRFDVVSTSGIGGLIGLLYAAPKGKSATQALKELPNLFVSDVLHRFAPLNFKLFFKNSPFAELAYELREHLPKIPVDPGSAAPVARLINDGMELVATALTPPSTESYRNALLSQVSMLEELVDFDALRDPGCPHRFYLNAFDLANQAQQTFGNRNVPNQHVGADAFRAAQAMFLLFPPEHVRGRLFTTGATHDPTGLQAIWLHERHHLDMVIALDPLSRAIWRHPVNVHDAFQLMLLNPIMALQVLTLALYAHTERTINPPLGSNAALELPRLYRIPFDAPPCAIPSAYYPQMLEWTHANAVTLERIGYCAATEFAQTLKFREADLDARYRYAGLLEDRSLQFLNMFGDLHLFDPEWWRTHPPRDRDSKYAPGGPTRPEERSR